MIEIALLISPGFQFPEGGIRESRLSPRHCAHDSQCSLAHIDGDDVHDYGH
jgi:hypothetical protein